MVKLLVLNINPSKTEQTSIMVTCLSLNGLIHILTAHHQLQQAYRNTVHVTIIQHILFIITHYHGVVY